MSEPLNWTTDEVMRALRVSSRDALKRLRDHKGLPFIQDGKEFVYPIDEVRGWNAARTQVKPVRERVPRQPAAVVELTQRRRQPGSSGRAIGPRPAKRLVAVS